MILKVWLLIILNVFVCKCQDAPPEVNTPLGRIRGTCKTSHTGKPYSAFEGIPYAKPPVGELRFEEPIPTDPWPGVWPATKSYLCPQAAFLGFGNDKGDEDCLYLNVYVPGKRVDPMKILNVHFHIHGGAFQFSSGELVANSTFMMDDPNVVFVSINYRLGALGFLSTEDDVIPGNNGMKDQVLALQWVKENIASFGGNPDHVTITGFSTGGVCVHLHYMSPLSKELFTKGISHSGTALLPFAFSKTPRLSTNRFASGLGCPIDSSEIIKKCLKNIPVSLILDGTRKMLEFGYSPLVPFGPVVENNSKNPFLAEHPYVLLKDGKIADLPWIASMSNDEGLLPTAVYCNRLDEINENFIDKGLVILELNNILPKSRRKQFLQKVKDYYLGENQDINEENFDKYKTLVTHGTWFWSIEMAVKMHSKATNSPVYFYLNNYSQGVNKFYKIYCPQKSLNGVCHCDDSIYAYGHCALNPFSENDKKVREAFYTMIESFVAGKQPCFDNNVKWIPTKGDELTFLNFTNYDDIHIQKVKSFVPAGVWDELIKAEFADIT